jgi:hypothetical protein
MQRYFLDFWVKRDPLNPEEAWLKYKQEVINADKHLVMVELRVIKQKEGVSIYNMENQVQNKILPTKLILIPIQFGNTIN